MKVYFLLSAKVVKRFETARKSVRNLCAYQQTQCVTAKKSTAPTAIYIAFDQRKVDDANRRVIDYVNGITC